MIWQAIAACAAVALMGAVVMAVVVLGLLLAERR